MARFTRHPKRISDVFDRSFLRGAVSGLLCVALVTALGARHVPSEMSLGPLARIFDSLSPWLLGVVCVGAGVIWALGGRRGAVALCAIAAIGGAEQAWMYRSISASVVPGAEVDARVLFFNVLHTNTASADRIISAALKEEPDIMIFAEAEGVYPAISRIPDTYRLLTPCRFEDCSFVIASRLPVVRSWQLSLNPAWPDRYAVVEARDRQGRAFFVAAIHLVKPWFSGLAEAEMERLEAQLDWLTLPTLAVGDFNAAPWSRPVSTVLRRTQMTVPRWPVATWPAGMGDWGLPIDLAMVHNGARIVSVTAFGGDLNSNHRGLIVDLSVSE
jgi:endonuclease/exonuclease/phosphatase (EEP) superfamily protein YafD